MGNSSENEWLMKLSRASSSLPFVVRSVPMSDSLEVPEAVSEVSPESFDDISHRPLLTPSFPPLDAGLKARRAPMPAQSV